MRAEELASKTFGLLAALCLAATAALAQQPQDTTAAPHSLPLDGSMLKARHLTYHTSLDSAGQVTALGDVDVQVTDCSYVGAPSWLLVSSGMRGSMPFLDSLFVARGDLRPLHWTASLGLGRLAVEFTGDSVFGATSYPLGEHNVVLAMRHDMLVNEAMVDAVLALLPLREGWTDSASILAVDVGGSSVSPATLEVDGSEQLTVPAGTFDAWIVSLEGERGAERLWVSKTDQTVLKSEQILPQLHGAVLERVLLAPTPIPVPPGRVDSARAIPVPPAGQRPVLSLHVSGHAGLWGVGGADRGAVASARRLESGPAPISRRPSRYRSRRRA